MRQNRHSIQRDEILNFLCSTADHPTAEQIYVQVRKTIPNISLGTVYRNLALLEDLGKVRRVTSGHDAEHFDANMSEHHHFICSKCGSIIDVKIDDPGLADLAGKKVAGCITGYDIVFHGLCECCAEKAAQEESFKAVVN